MANVGTVSGIGFVFASNVQFVGNSNGVVYSDIDNLLLNNQAWQAGNSGTFEKFEGEFDLIQKASGFSIANGDATAIDVSSNPTVSQGVINGTVFSGSSANYINKYTTAAINLNFTKDWFVQVSGIQDEYDDIASGNIFYEGDLNTGYTITSLNTGSPFKLTGTTTSSNLLRFIAVGNNRLEYIGNQQKRFSINASLSVRGTSTGNPFYAFFIRKNGSETLEETNSIFYVSNTTNVSSVSITGNVMLSPGDYIEIWGQKLTGTTIGALTIFSQNLTVN
jgi:hypothetical protein